MTLHSPFSLYMSKSFVNSNSRTLPMKMYVKEGIQNQKLLTGQRLKAFLSFNNHEKNFCIRGLSSLDDLPVSWGALNQLTLLSQPNPNLNHNPNSILNPNTTKKLGETRQSLKNHPTHHHPTTNSNYLKEQE